MEHMPSLELTLSGCVETSGATLEGEFANGLELGDTEKGMVGEEEEEEENDPSEDSEEKEHKILLGESAQTMFHTHTAYHICVVRCLE